jgi:hypothetical protein
MSIASGLVMVPEDVIFILLVLLCIVINQAVFASCLAYCLFCHGAQILRLYAYHIAIIDSRNM